MDAIVRIFTSRSFLKSMIPRIVSAAICVFLLVAYAVPLNAMTERADDASLTERILVVRPGDSLAELLDDAGIDPAVAHAATTALSTVFSVRKIRPGHEIAVQTSPANNNALVALEIEPSPGRIARAQLRNGNWEAEEIVLPSQRFLVLADGTIIGGLFPSLTTAGMPAGLALSLIRVLGHQIDFQRDLRPGDRFSVLFERLRAEDGDLLGHGHVLQVELVLSGKRLSFWRHVAPDGAIDWFDAEGRSLRRSFLRTPLDGARISSGFGRRTHPILGYSRMHQGMDFAAPTGTGIYAAADGTVVSARYEGAYGRMIRLRHASGVETRYAHLSSFARGIGPGRKIKQGDVIGSVGSTGLSTGPHLHYEIVLKGRPVNPATYVSPPTQLRGRELIAFQKARTGLTRSATNLKQLVEVAMAD